MSLEAEGDCSWPGCPRPLYHGSPAITAIAILSASFPPALLQVLVSLQTPQAAMCQLHCRQRCGQTSALAPEGPSSRAVFSPPPPRHPQQPTTHDDSVPLSHLQKVSPRGLHRLWQLRSGTGRKHLHVCCLPTPRLPHLQPVGAEAPALRGAAICPGHFLTMGLRPWGALLLLLPGIVLGSNQNGDRDSITVVLLVLFLLLLLLVLALAWHKLSKDSDGKYHPKHLCQPCRALAALRVRWQALRGRSSSMQGWQEEYDDDEEEEEKEEEEEEQQKLCDMEEGRGRQEQHSQEEEQDEKEEEEDEDKDADTIPAFPETPEGSQEAVCVTEGGNAEALLSNLHSFSGTATWEDSPGEGAKNQHVTAL
ncbi:protein tyrosine phosphatase receptor type C-associated protein [Alligator sinensis]|uniref:Protein tyrosine phosphatase receptor type C-associated protein n=1 Tax=Alligator sinensis TaxID=38654 RepID=A0A1U7SPJ0_ALLSI|nr:protein tyrosine phosphatase receptor type C-associated protein [Alligator sinensis]